jgi:hypothetical protein
LPVIRLPPPLTIRECWCVPKIVPVQIMK